MVEVVEVDDIVEVVVVDVVEVVDVVVVIQEVLHTPSEHLVKPEQQLYPQVLAL